MIAEGPRDALVKALTKFLEEDPSRAWPAWADARAKGKAISLEDVDIVVLPLDRIGAPAGASGASVVVAYFSDSDRGRLLASAPLVVKWGELKYLREERDFDWPTLDTHTAPCFAKPIRLDETNHQYPMLIAPFRSGFEPDVEGQRQEIRVNDIWSLLQDKSELDPTKTAAWKGNAHKLGQHIRSALDTMSKVHRNNRGSIRREELSYVSCYPRYLRNMHPAAKSGGAARTHIAKSIFGDENTVAMFNRKWTNPMAVLTTILEKDGSRFSGVLGPVHGDLHPKNIVIAKDESIGIIDFGWAHHSRHVAADYVLLDINVRAMTLPSQINHEDVVALACFLDPGDRLSALPSSVRARGDLIQSKIWKRAKANRGVIEQWREEYLIPLFIVAYGLMAHMDSARNQAALIATVLAAANKIEPLAP